MFTKCYVDFSLVESQDELATVMSEIQLYLEEDPIIMVMKADPGVLRDENGNIASYLFVK